MANIDDLGALKQLDPSGVLESTGKFPDQCAQAWRVAKVDNYLISYSRTYQIR